MNNRPILVAGGIIHRGDKILLAQRLNRGPQGEAWEFPGGKVEFGEDPRDCLRREIKEELDIEIEVHEPQEIVSVVLTVDGEERNYAIVFFNATYVRGDFVFHDCKDAQWIDPSQLKTYHLSVGTAEVVRRLYS